jgi:hypothetical protein
LRHGSDHGKERGEEPSPVGVGVLLQLVFGPMKPPKSPPNTQPAIRFHAVFLRFLAPVVLGLPAIAGVADEYRPSNTSSMRPFAPPARRLPLDWDLQHSGRFHHEYEVRGIRGASTEEVALSWRYATATEAATRLSELQADTQGTDVEPTHMRVVAVRLPDQPIAAFDLLGRNLKIAQASVDAASNSLPAEYRVSDRSLPQLADFLDRLEQASAAVYVVLSDFGTCFNRPDNYPRRLSPTGQPGVANLTDADFAQINWLLTSFNATTSHSFVLSDKARRAASPRTLSMLNELSKGSLAIPAAGYVVTAVLKSGTFANGQAYMARSTSSLEQAKREGDYYAAFYTRYCGSHENVVVIRIDAIYSRAQFNDLDAVDRFAARNASEILHLRHVLTTNLDPMLDGSHRGDGGVWVASNLSKHPFSKSKERYAYQICASKSQAEKLATTWKAQGLTAEVALFKNDELAIQGYLAGGAERQSADRATREREEQSAAKALAERKRKSAAKIVQDRDERPASQVLQTREEQKRQQIAERYQGPRDVGRRPEEQMPKQPKERQPGSVAGTIWTSNTNREEFIFESSGRFIRRWNFGYPVEGECGGLWTQKGSEVTVDQESPCMESFEITVAGNQLRVHLRSGTVSVFYKK